MSAKLARKVLESALPTHLKFTAQVCALLWATDEGDNIFASPATVALYCSKTERQVRRDFSELQALGVFVPEDGQKRNRKGFMVGGRTSTGRGRTVRYILVEAALPKRTWPTINNDADVTLNSDTGVTVNSDADVTLQKQARVTFEPRRVTPTTARVTPTTEKGDIHVTRSGSDQLAGSESLISCADAAASAPAAASVSGEVRTTEPPAATAEQFIERLRSVNPTVARMWERDRARRDRARRELVEKAS